MAYLNDLKGYWIKSYGNEDTNSKMSFLIIKDLFEKMEHHIKSNLKKPNVFLRFGHAENIFPLITALNLFKDEHPLTADLYEKHSKRQFKSAYITPFGSNLAFVLNKCKSLERADDEFVVSLYLNELPINMIRAGDLACSIRNNSVCGYDDLKRQLNKYLRMEFEETCNINKNDKNEL